MDDQVMEVAELSQPCSLWYFERWFHFRIIHVFTVEVRCD